jgi:lipoic acid synthetase
MAALSTLPTAHQRDSRKSPSIKIETLVPDFRGRMDRAEILQATPRMCLTITWKTCRACIVRFAGADYNWSLKLLERFKAHPEIPTKSGLMVGLGETNDEIIEVMRDLRRHGVTMLTLGQYLQPAVTTCRTALRQPG